MDHCKLTSYCIENYFFFLNSQINNFSPHLLYRTHTFFTLYFNSLKKRLSPTYCSIKLQEQCSLYRILPSELHCFCNWHFKGCSLWDKWRQMWILKEMTQKLTLKMQISFMTSYYDIQELVLVQVVFETISENKTRKKNMNLLYT